MKNYKRGQHWSWLTLLVVPLCMGATSPEARAAEPPFTTTSRLEPKLIVSQDPTTFAGISRKGRGQRTVFDRRESTRISMMAYLLSARYKNSNRTVEFQVNPEFGREGSLRQARKYAREIGRLPTVLLSGIRTVVIHRGDEALGGSDGNILIHTGRAQKRANDGFLEETLFHEGTHASLDKNHKNTSEWNAAQREDGRFLIPYAKKYPDREDIAASFIMWMAVRYLPGRLTPAQVETTETTIPNRLGYFDKQKFAMKPIADRSVDPTTKPPFTFVTRLSSDIITDEDPNFLENVSAAGRGQRTAFDKRQGQSILMNAYLFQAQYEGTRTIEFQVNPEYGKSAAETAASRYANTLGYLPKILIDRIDRVVIHLGEQRSHTRDGAIIIHANRAFSLWQKGLYAETLTRVATQSLADSHVRSPDWLAAQEQDESGISDFAEASASNDFGESFLAWMLVRWRSNRVEDAQLKTISDTIPARIDYLDRQGFWMYGEAPDQNEKGGGGSGESGSEREADDGSGNQSGSGGTFPLLLALSTALLRARSRARQAAGHTSRSNRRRPGGNSLL